MIDGIDKWRKAGAIAAEALEYGRKLIKNGANIREVCDKIDQKVIDLGAKPAWPAQMSMDDVAAHATPEPDDDAVFDNNVASLDVGAQLDGFIGDNATTVDLSGEHKDIINAAKDALAAVEKMVAPGVKLGDVGKAIQEAIESHDCRPVRNLSGHGISRWVIHDTPSVPNFANGSTTTLKPGMIIASEPFATKGTGMIHEVGEANIFALRQKKPVRSPYAREVLQFIDTTYKNLPFTTRWLTEKFGPGKTKLALRELVNASMLHEHPPLVERSNLPVAVFEKTFLITENGSEVLTKQ